MGMTRVWLPGYGGPLAPGGLGSRQEDRTLAGILGQTGVCGGARTQEGASWVRWCWSRCRPRAGLAKLYSGAPAVPGYVFRATVAPLRVSKKHEAPKYQDPRLQGLGQSGPSGRACGLHGGITRLPIEGWAGPGLCRGHRTAEGLLRGPNTERCRGIASLAVSLLLDRRLHFPPSRITAAPARSCE